MIDESENVANVENMKRKRNFTMKLLFASNIERARRWRDTDLHIEGRLTRTVCALRFGQNMLKEVESEEAVEGLHTTRSRPHATGTHGPYHPANQYMPQLLQERNLNREHPTTEPLCVCSFWVGASVLRGSVRALGVNS